MKVSLTIEKVETEAEDSNVVIRYNGKIIKFNNGRVSVVVEYK